MERKIKYITFHTKERLEDYETRTCSPYNYPKCSKYTVSVRKVLCKYKKIITKNCRINDILKFMDTDLAFPTNSNDYTNLLIEITENSHSYFDSLSMVRSSIDIGILRLAFYSIQDNYPIIESMLYNELEKSYPANIKTQAKILKLNLIICTRIFIKATDFAGDWMVNKVVENLRIYITHLRTLCSFIYLIILKKKSTMVNKMLHTKFRICSLCGQTEVGCMCFSDLESTSNQHYEQDDDYLSPKVVKKVRDESIAHCSKSTDDDVFWHQYLENYGYDNQKSIRDSQGSSTDTD